MNNKIISYKIKLGWQVNTHAVGDLVREIENSTDADVDSVISEYKIEYTFNTDDVESIRYQARVEIAIGRILDSADAEAYTNTFEDLHGIKQFRGLRYIG